MKYISFILLVLLPLALPAFESGNGGTGVGSGGDAVTCRGRHEVCYRRTPTSPRTCKVIKIEGLVTAEFYAAMGFAENSEVTYLKTWSKLTYRQTLDRLFEKLRRAPFYSEFLKRAQMLGTVGNGLALHFPLVNIDDSTIPFEVEKNKCRIAQAVARVDDLFYFDPMIWKSFGENLHANQQALMDFHEFLYAFGKERFHHTTSRQTQRVITWFLMRDLTPAQFDYVLKAYDFTEAR